VTTYLAKPRHRQVRWRVIDAEGKVLGRLASRAARALMGKDSPDWTPHADHREGLIIINAERIRLTGRKLDNKLYRHYTGYPGGLREISARNILEKKPERLLAEAIRGMLPKTSLGDRLATRLRIYTGGTYPHQAQRPEALDPARV
jgi:large subunit ribosomal protein L13